jgi:hypothetical protein
MKEINRLKYIIVILIILLTTLLISIAADSTEKPFNQIELSENNQIVNNTAISFLDTIASVGLDAAGITGVHLEIYKLTDEAKDNFSGGELNAHIRYHNGIYYMFIDEMSRQKSITVVSHEIVHINQYQTGMLDYLGDRDILWNGELISLDNVEYENRPWETDAYLKETEISTKVSGILY